MTRQQQWDRLFLKFAYDVSQMSRATRLQVGAVAVKDRRVVCIGYNGTPEGENNCCELIVKAGFSRVIFSYFYRDTSGVYKLLDKGIVVDC